MAIITVSNNADMNRIGVLWDFTNWPVPPVDNLDGTWTVPDEFADALTAALNDMDKVEIDANEAQANQDIAATGMSVAQLLAVTSGITPPPTTSAPPAVEPPQTPVGAIASVLDGTVNASSGHTFDLAGGAKMWVISPVPDLPGPGATLSIPIPAYTTPISVDGMVLDQGGTTWWQLGASRVGSASSINMTITATDVVLTTTNPTDWQASGYMAFTYLP